MSGYVAQQHTLGNWCIWHFIVGAEYVTVASRNLFLGDVLQELQEIFDDKFKKPVVLINVHYLGKADYKAMAEAELIDYEFGE